MDKAHIRRNWSRGLRKERREIRKLRSAGWFVVRSAGSQGAADAVAFNPETKEIKLIQYKTDNFIENCSENQKQLILEPLKALEGVYHVTSELR